MPNHKNLKEIFTISELAYDLEVSPPAIRFYEDKGLIAPARSPGNQRIYNKKDRARLKLILRGKRFGFSLDEIAEMIGLAEVDMDEIDQIEHSLIHIDRRCEDIRQRRIDLELLEKDLLSFKKKLTIHKKALKNRDEISM